MGIYAKMIADRKLVKELKKSATRDDVPAEEVEKLVALVNEVADVAGPLLERIPVTFKQYTEHNIVHCRNLIDLMGRFIPRETLKQMNGLELSVLILSALLHDFGMFVSEEEKRETLTLPEFDSFLASHHDRATALEEARKKGDHARAEVIQDALLAEYFRRMHPERARQNVRANLPGKLVYGGTDISEYVLDVCESHAWGVRESNDPKYAGKAVSRLSTNKAVYGVPLNLQYIACCLRLADIMDFDRSRTPVVVFQNLDFTEAKSWEEWNKHLSVKGWVINERDVMFRAECKHPAFYVAVMEFLDWVDNELGECRRLVVKEAPRDVAERYKLHLPPVVDRSEVEMEDKSYLAGAFRFQLEYERIMKLLMDKSLYPDPSLFLRELLQNSLDACRNREAYAREAGQESLYTPRIVVWDYSDDADKPRIVFQDNGVGMSRKIVENYFMRVGRSYYRSPEFDAERAQLKKKGIELVATSQFGIGILSCFMVADRFEVETYRTGHQPLHITIEGPTKYFTIQLLPEPPRADFTPRPATSLEDCPPRHPGTRVTVHLRPGTKLDLFQTLDTFATNVEYDINIYGPGAAEPRTIARRRWEAEPSWDSMLEGALAKGRNTSYPWMSDEDITRMAQNIGGILTPSRIPFERYDFSSQLRGAAWFWLLKGEDGRACAERGYLQIVGDSLDLTSLPGLAGQLCSYKPTATTFQSPSWAELIAALKSSIDERRMVLPGTAEYTAIGAAFDRSLAELFVPRFTQEWNGLSEQERNVLYNSLKLTSENPVSWYKSEAAIESLLLGNYDWSEMSLDLRSGVRIPPHPMDISLYGLLLPGGFLEWKPMEGSSLKVTIMEIAGGVQIDIRGSNAPVPAASRLFVDSSEAAKMIVPFLRATMRHALELTSNNPVGDGWQDWVSYLFSRVTSIPHWKGAAREEYDLLESSMKYGVVNEIGEVERLSRQEVIARYGRWAPIYHSYTEGKKSIELEGVYQDSLTQMLITFKESRENGERLEVDMESFITSDPE